MSVLLVRSEADAIEAGKSFRQAVERGDDLLAFDTETTGLLVRSGLQDYGRTVQFSWRPWTEAVVFEMTGQWRRFINRFFELAGELVGHNTKFDIHVMETFGVPLYDMFKPHEVHDTVWLSRLYDENPRPQLKPLADLYIGEDSSEEQAALKRAMNKHGWDWATVPVEELVQYGGTDSIITGKLYDFLRPQIGYAEDAYRREQELAPIVYRMERTGLLVDQAVLTEVIEEETRNLADAEAEVERLSPGLNPNSPKQLKAALEARGRIVADTTASTLKALDDDLARAVIRVRESSKTLNTYARPWREVMSPEGRVHSSLNQMGTRTGRFSSSEPNFQNISKTHRLRECIVAGPGNVLVVADWQQMELRLYAHFAQDENMRAAFLAGEDIYQQVADILGLSRTIGKMVMLASIYGAGPKTLGEQVVAMAWKYGMDDLVPELMGLDWKDVHQRFHKAYGIRDLARATEEVAKRRRDLTGEAFITTIGGRRQRPKTVVLPPLPSGWRPTKLVFKDLANSLIQGSSADLMKESIIAMDRLGYGDYLRLTVHDEMVLEVPEPEAEEVAEAVKRVMTRTEFTPPLTAEVSIARNYLDAK